MPLVEVNWQPTHRQLRQFAMICLVALPFLGWLWGGSPRTVWALGAAGLVLAITGWFVPKAIRPVFIALSVVAAPLGIIISELVLLLMFFGVFLPLGLIFRLLRRDALQMQLDRQAKSYWQPKKQPRSMASYYRQS